MENLNLSILTGGYYHCTPSWDTVKRNRDACYKIYFPMDGEAQIKVRGTWYPLVSGQAYFINGFELEQQSCSHSMHVYWLHFTPQSQILNLHLKSLQPVYSWGANALWPALLDTTQIADLFFDPESDHSIPRESIDLSLQCSIHGLIHLMIADMSKSQEASKENISPILLQKLQPALGYIHANYAENITLEEMARQAFLSKAYFLRLFKSCYKQTPYQYLLTVRMQEAARLLSRTNLSVKQISDRLGYCNQFHLAKAFKSYYQCSPLAYRQKRLLP